MPYPIPHLLVGQVLYGYCEGYFGRDSYGNKRVEAVGVDWVVARENGNEVVFAQDEHIHEVLIKHTVKPPDADDDY